MSASSFSPHRFHYSRTGKSSSLGFTLLELMLVLGVLVVLGTLAFAGQVRDRDLALARATGQQIKIIGNALNEYIATNHESLVNLISAPGATDPGGPRICDTTSTTCTINVNTLINSGSLPPGFRGITPYQSAYVIKIKRRPIGGTGTYSLDGLVTTALPWITAGTVPRYDLLGAAIQQAGADAGMSRASATKIDGYNGMWSATSTDFSGINKVGLLGYRAGYSSNAYGAFLRLDGSTKMTGPLDMGINTIENAQDIMAKGGIQAQSMYINGGVIQLGPTTSNLIYQNSGAGGNNETVLSQNNGVLIVDSTGNPADLAAVRKINASGDITTQGNIIANGQLQIHNKGSDGNTLSLYNQGSLANTGKIYADQIQIAHDANNTASDPTASATRFSLYGSGLVSNNWDVYQSLHVNSISALASGNAIAFDGASSVIVNNGLYLQGGLYLNQVINTSSAASCTSAQKGSIARSPSGGLLICANSGYWKPTAILTTVVRYGPQTADIATPSEVYCGYGSYATGGGYRRTGIRGGATTPPEAPIDSTPIPPSAAAGKQQGGWQVTGGSIDSYFTPFAMCTVVND